MRDIAKRHKTRHSALGNGNMRSWLSVCHVPEALYCTGWLSVVNLLCNTSHMGYAIRQLI